MKNLLIIALLCTGCSTFLRYDYQAALRNLPQNTRVVDVRNDYIKYETYTTNKLEGSVINVNGKIYTSKNNVDYIQYHPVTVRVYKARYGDAGKIIETIEVK